MSNGGNAKLVNDLGKKLLDAARIGNADEVSELMKNGAPLITDWLGTTPLHLAAIYGHTKTAQVLIKSGISRDGRTKVDKVPLHFACQHGHFEIVKLLVNSGAHINATDMIKMTPLHWAVEANSFEICIFLLKSGAQITIKNKFGKTALRIAQDKEYTPLVKLISSNEFKVLQNLDVLRPTLGKDHMMSSVKICRPENFFNSMSQPPQSLMKKHKPKRYPMIPGRWINQQVQTKDRQDVNDVTSQTLRWKVKEDKKTDVKSRLKQLNQSQANNHHHYRTSVTPLARQNALQDNLIKVLPNYSGDSPLQKLQETVRKQGMENRKLQDGNSETEKRQEKTSGNENFVTNSKISLPVISLEYPTSTSSSLHQGIPVISAKTLVNLPDNVKAIPLDFFGKEEKIQKIQDDNPIKTESNPNIRDLERKYFSEMVTDENPSDDNCSIPVGIPLNLLHQIFSGDIVMQAKRNKKGKKDINKLLGINTDRGMIPILPVSGPGGFHLIPLEDDSPETSEPSSQPDIDSVVSTPTVSTTQLENSKSVSLSNEPSDTTSASQTSQISYSTAAAANLSMLAAHHGGFDTANAILQAQRQQMNQVVTPTPTNVSIGVSPQVILPNSMLLHPTQTLQRTHIYHPATYLQLPTAMIQPTHVVQPTIIPAVAQPSAYFTPPQPSPIFQAPPIFVPPTPIMHSTPISPYLFVDPHSVNQNINAQAAPQTVGTAAAP